MTRIRRHIAYGRYLIRHKTYVTIECFKRGLIWRGLVHDLSKFRPSEWFPYARYFYHPDGRSTQVRDSLGAYLEPPTGEPAFDYAWLLHQKRNRHHWQYWVLREDSGGTKLLPMPILYATEMVCDWTGAGLAQGHGRDLGPWYEKNKDKMKLHPETRNLIEVVLREEG